MTVRLTFAVTAVVLASVDGLGGPFNLRGPCGGKVPLKKSAVSFGGAAFLAASLCAGPPVAHGETLKMMRVQQQQQRTEQALELTAKDKKSLRDESAAVAKEEYPKAKNENAARSAKADEVVESAGRPATKKDIADLKTDLNDLKTDLNDVETRLRNDIQETKKLDYATLIILGLMLLSTQYIDRAKL